MPRAVIDEALFPKRKLWTINHITLFILKVTEHDILLVAVNPLNHWTLGVNQASYLFVNEKFYSNIEVFSRVRAWVNNLFFLQKGMIMSHITISDSTKLK